MNILLDTQFHQQQHPGQSWVWEKKKPLKLRSSERVFMFLARTVRCWRPRRRDAPIIVPRFRKNGNFHVCTVEWVGKGCWFLGICGAGNYLLLVRELIQSTQSSQPKGGVEWGAHNRIVLLDALWKVDWFCTRNYDLMQLKNKIRQNWSQLKQNSKKMKMLSLSRFWHKWPSGEELLMDG